MNLEDLSVLLVEDAAEQRARARDMLLGLGLRRVAAVESAPQALDELRGLGAGVVLCSERLGVERGVLRAVRRRSPASCAILLGATTPAVRRRAHELGAAEVLEAPFSSAALELALRRALARIEAPVAPAPLVWREPARWAAPALALLGCAASLYWDLALQSSAERPPREERAARALAAAPGDSALAAGLSLAHRSPAPTSARAPARAQPTSLSGVVESVSPLPERAPKPRAMARRNLVRPHASRRRAPATRLSPPERASMDIRTQR